MYWSASNAPHINGIYYDGINFARRSMRRVRRVLDRAAAETGRDITPLIDIHTGYGGSKPPALMYLSHFAYANSAWNGEGFQFQLGPLYWLYDISGFQHGITADRLGDSEDFKGMTFGTYRRNSATASALWSLWDAVGIADMEMVGWWEDDTIVKLLVPQVPTPPPSDCPSSFSNMTGAYWEACGGTGGNIGFGAGCGPGAEPSYPNLTIAEAEAICCELHKANGARPAPEGYSRVSMHTCIACASDEVQRAHWLQW